MSASWPTTVATDATLYVAVNELQNNLSGAINSAVTTIGLNSTTGFPTVGLVLIDNEVIKYTNVSGNNLTGCTRGFDGTTAASHSSAAVVSFAFCAQHHNGLKDEVIAIETSLNFTASRALSTDTNGRAAVATTTLAELNFVSGVTSAIQTQINTKAPSASPTFTGTITTPLTASRVLTTGASSELAASSVTTTTLGFLDATSSIQTQLNGKQATMSDSDVTGKLLTGLSSSDGVISASDSLLTALNKAGFHRVMQAPVIATTTSGFSTTNSAFQTTNLTASITPKATTSKILVFANGTLITNVGTNLAYATISRGGSNIAGANGLCEIASTAGGQLFGNGAMFYLDSPSSTSSQTYAVQIKSANGSSTVAWGDGTQVIILIEIGA